MAKEILEKFEVMVLKWDTKIRTVDAEDYAHAAELIAEEYDEAHGNVLLNDTIEIIVRKVGEDIVKTFDATAKESIEYDVVETE